MFQALTMHMVPTCAKIYNNNNNNLKTKGISYNNNKNVFNFYCQKPIHILPRIIVLYIA